MGIVVRGLLALIGLLIMLGGLGVLVYVGDLATGLWTVFIGGVLVVAIALERQRYRSEAAERTNAQPGPGGGELPDGRLEPRFRPTEEVFVDPTSGHRMRVLVDPATGERRYVAEA
jgi:hypothetical protein